MSAAISLLHSSYMDECCHGKESTSVCAGEQLRWKKLWDSADMTYGIFWSHGNLVREMLTHFISLKHVILAFY